MAETRRRGFFSGPYVLAELLLYCRGLSSASISDNGDAYSSAETRSGDRRPPKLRDDRSTTGSLHWVSGLDLKYFSATQEALITKDYGQGGRLEGSSGSSTCPPHESSENPLEHRDYNMRASSSIPWSAASVRNVPE